MRCTCVTAASPWAICKDDVYVDDDAWMMLMMYAVEVSDVEGRPPLCILLRLGGVSLEIYLERARVQGRAGVLPRLGGGDNHSTFCQKRALGAGSRGCAPRLLLNMSTRIFDSGSPSIDDPFFDLGHYHEFSPPTRMPSTAQLSSAVQRNSEHQLVGSEILFVLLSSCALPGRLRLADETWCGPHHDGVQCWAYMDCDQMSTGEMPLTSVQTVTPSEYLIPWHAPAQDCCSPAKRPGGPDGFGPSRYYCANTSEYAAHVAQTLPAQYRFLPALHHASTTHLGEGKRWLVMVDDDSWVTIPRLLHVLGQHNHKEPLQVSTWRCPHPSMPPRPTAPAHAHACACKRVHTHVRPSPLAVGRFHSSAAGQPHALEAALRLFRGRYCAVASSS